ncbi:MAG: hypothetical protein ACREQT_06615, partial [Candidatus Binataceae bacterium]
GRSVANEPNGPLGSAGIETETDEPNYESLFAFLSLMRRWRRPLVLITLSVIVLTALVTEFVAVHWYRATAVMRPVSQHESPALNSLVGGVGQIASMLGAAGSGNDMKAQEFIATLESYDFVVALIEQDDLAGHLDATRGYLSRFFFPHLTMWDRYQLVMSRFDTEYSVTTGNLTVSYEDADPHTAVRILGLFIKALREKVQRRELETARAAAASLMEEADHSADALLRGQIYLMAADQIKQERLAQISADFAFFVIQSPIAPDDPSRPRVGAIVILIGAFTAILLVLAAVAIERFQLLRAKYRAALARLPTGAAEVRNVAP